MSSGGSATTSSDSDDDSHDSSSTSSISSNAEGSGAVEKLLDMYRKFLLGFSVFF